MRFDTLIRGGTIVTATDTYVSDVGIVGGKISVIGLNLPAEDAGKVIEAREMLLLPGGIDVHTHLDMPFGGTTSADDFESGTVAAAYGGTTTLIDFAIQYKGQTLRHAFDTWMKKADGKVMIVDAKGDTSTVTIPNVNQSNGVIHVIDTVLLPAS